MKIVADKMGIDVHEVINAAAQSKTIRLRCITQVRLRRPLDPYRPVLPDLEARKYGVNTRFIELAGEVSSHMPDYVNRKSAWLEWTTTVPSKTKSWCRYRLPGKNVDDMRGRLWSDGPPARNWAQWFPTLIHTFQEFHIPGHHHFDLKSEALTLNCRPIRLRGF